MKTRISESEGAYKRQPVPRASICWLAGTVATLVLGYVLGAWIYWPSMSRAAGVRQPMHFIKAYLRPQPWTLAEAAPPAPGPTPFAPLWGPNTVMQSFTACADHLAMVRVWLAPTRGTPTVRVSLLGSRDPTDVLYAADLTLQEQGRYYALVFPPIADSRDTKFWVRLGAPSATEAAPVAVRAGYVDAVGGLLYINEYRATGDLDFGAYYRGWPGLWTLRVVGERLLPRLVVERLSQYKPLWAKGSTFVWLAGLLVLGCVALLWFSWPGEPVRSDRPHVSRIAGVGMVLLVTLLALGWRDVCVAVGIGEKRIPLAPGRTASDSVEHIARSTGDPLVTHALLTEFEFAGRHPEPIFMRGHWVDLLEDGAHVTPWAIPAIDVPGLSRINYRLDVPYDGDLRFRYGLKEQGGTVAVHIGGEQVWQAAPEVGKWAEATLDLRPWGGQSVVLSFVAEGGGRALWGTPQVTSQRTWLSLYPLDMETVDARATYARFTGIPGSDTQGDVLELLGYDVLPGEDKLQVTLYWHAARPVTGDYTVFVHALDAVGQMCGQKDSRPLDGTYPTFFWPTARVIMDRYEIPLEHRAVRLVVGLYELKSLDRLPAFDTDSHRYQDDAVQLEWED